MTFSITPTFEKLLNQGGDAPQQYPDW